MNIKSFFVMYFEKSFWLIFEQKTKSKYKKQANQEYNFAIC